MTRTDKLGGLVTEKQIENLIQANICQLEDRSLGELVKTLGERLVVAKVALADLDRKRAEAYKKRKGKGAAPAKLATLAETVIPSLEALPHIPLSRVGSWAVWDEYRKNDRTWVVSQGLLEDFAEGRSSDGVRPHTRAVLVGLNFGNGVLRSSVQSGDRGDINFQAAADLLPWSDFHGSSRRGGVPDPARNSGNIRMVSDALRSTNYWGSYMTDVFKNLPSANGADLKEILASFTLAGEPDGWELVSRFMIRTLERELTIVGASPDRTILVQMGNAVEELLDEHFSNWKRVRVGHYSDPRSRVQFDALPGVLDDLVDTPTPVKVTIGPPSVKDGPATVSQRPA